jgi:predicted kinase
MSNIIILSGLPRSGKTTLVNRVLEVDESYIKISADNLRYILYGHRFFEGGEEFVWGARKVILKMLMQQNKNIIVDECNNGTARRQMLLSLAKLYEYQTTIIHINTDSNTCRDRAIKENDMEIIKIIDFMSGKFQDPTIEEANNLFTTYGDIKSINKVIDRLMYLAIIPR